MQVKNPVLSSRTFHLLLLAAGLLFLLTNAFHSNVWFDESYSVALANHSFSDMWRIGSSDVHPVLFYGALHIFEVVFGQNILVYRLFSLAGAFALAFLGYSHLRHDFGWKVGLLFSFFALFTPYIAIMATEIRMYSWATFSVMVCAIYAYRIFMFHHLSPQPTSSKTLPSSLRLPWIIFTLSSLASAYLHYFALLSVFVINLFLGIYLLVKIRQTKKDFFCFLLSALLQIALYLPWLFALSKQLGVVSETYWIHWLFPTSLIELTTYPLMTSQISFALRGAYGPVWGIILAVLTFFGLLLLGVIFIRAGFKVIKKFSSNPNATHITKRSSFSAFLKSDALAPTLALALYLAIGILAFFASYFLHSLLVYYRYLFVAIGPLLFISAFICSRLSSRFLLSASLSTFLVFSLINQTLLISDNYSEKNKAPLSYFSHIAAPGELILSSDIGIEGVTAVEYPDIPQTYLNWQKGNWGNAYEAYSPTLSVTPSWEAVLTSYQGRFIVLGASSLEGTLPRSISDLSQKEGITLIDSQTFFRPYERTYFTIATMEK